ncbi:hypothetical protein [Salinimonas iocasae]|uniref:Uncharacterized protein n=1 Tax=Salinimonas iocasae TaxID=2572577 RepID=A0A5B7YGF0_9ALTE|nr:hypothetical protein [Salinimonas iocasae]QCZ94440.1 hypothetical protein FBQ74_13620 [Salinimonas iocasae]
MKLGGLFAGAFGKSHIYHNLITVGRNGIAASRFQEDNTFYTHAQNNIVITQKDANMVGLNVYDPQQFGQTRYVNNYFFNTKKGEPKMEGTITVPYAYPSEVNTKNAENWADSAGQVMFPANDTYYIPNFTLKNAQQDAYINGVVN